MIKKILFPLLLILAATPARSQYLGQVSPQTTSQQVFNAVTTAQATPNSNPTPKCVPASGGNCAIPNLGQNFHILSYINSNSSDVFQLRLEGSLDGVNFFPISEDATSQASGAVYAQGYYPVIRANLIFFSGPGSITAIYDGTSSGSFPLTGVLNQSQTFKKILANNQAGAAGTQVYTLNPPCGNASGVLFFQFNSGPTTTTATLFAGVDSVALFPSSFTSYPIASTLNVQAFPVPSQPGTFIEINVSPANGSTYSMQYIFNCPAGAGAIGAGSPSVAGLLQPASTGNSQFNKETVSNTNTAVTFNPGGSQGTRWSLFSVNARCSAGTASLTVQDGATTIWSTAATEVGTTTFKFQWSPGLAGSIGNSMAITLSTCGSGNTGTLDVQASQN